MKRPIKSEPMFPTEKGLFARVCHSFKGLPRKKADKVWKLCREDWETHILFITGDVYVVELVADGTSIYLIYDVSNMAPEKTNLTEGLMMDFNRTLELVGSIIYDGRIHRPHSRDGQLIMDALKKGISPNINALLEPATGKLLNS